MELVAVHVLSAFPYPCICSKASIGMDSHAPLSSPSADSIRAVCGYCGNTTPVHRFPTVAQQKGHSTLIAFSYCPALVRRCHNDHKMDEKQQEKQDRRQ